MMLPFANDEGVTHGLAQNSYAELVFDLFSISTIILENAGKQCRQDPRLSFRVRQPSKMVNNL